jgi:hypothetical protein
MGTSDCFLEEKWQGHEADHLPPACVEVNNGGAIPSLSIYLHSMVLCIINSRDKFTLFTIIVV